MGLLVTAFGQGTDVVTLHSAVTSFTTPTTAGTGADVSGPSKVHGNAGPQKWSLDFSADGATVLTGPLAAYGTYADGAVVYAGLIGDGADIIIPNAGVGVAFAVNTGPFLKLQVAPPPDASNLTGRTATASAGAHVTVKARPVYEVVV